MNITDLKNAISTISLALNATHNTIATDAIEAQPTDTAWRVDNAREIQLCDEILSAVSVDYSGEAEQFVKILQDEFAKSYDRAREEPDRELRMIDMSFYVFAREILRRMGYTV